MEITAQDHAFVTGGASGIGRAIGDALAARGAAVTLADVDGERLASVVGARGPRFRGAALDTRDREGWAAAKAAAEAAFGPVSILVNNAGIAPDGRELADMDAASFDRIIGINLVGVFNGIHAFGAAMRGLGRGHIVNTSSMAGLASAHPGLGAYGAAKAGVVQMSEVLHREMAPYGIGVSVVCPGLVATNLGETTAKLGGRIRPEGSMTAMGGSDPALVGEAVAQAVEGNQLYVITHPDRRDGVAARFEAILAAFG